MTQLVAGRMYSRRVETLARPLDMFQYLVEERLEPREWKTTNVVPIFRKTIRKMH